MDRYVSKSLLNLLRALTAWKLCQAALGEQRVGNLQSHVVRPGEQPVPASRQGCKRNKASSRVNVLGRIWIYPSLGAMHAHTHRHKHTSNDDKP